MKAKNEDNRSGARPHIVVLGAGVCGLYTARVLVDRGVDVTLVERLSGVGGLASGYEINGNYYDIGVHHLHMFDQEIFEDIMTILDGRLHPVELSAKIKHGRGFRRYPLEFGDLLLGIPPWTLIYCVSGLLLQQLRNKINLKDVRNAEEALIQIYGRPLYNYFFRDFTHRYWGIPPTELSATFVKRKMPRLSAVDVIKNWLSKFGFKEKKGMAVESALRKETLYFSRIGASMMPNGIAEYIQSKGGNVILDAEVVSVQADDDVVTSVTYEQDGIQHTLECDACISTIPLNTLVGRIEPQPSEEVLEACRQLRYKAIVIYGLLVKKEQIFDDALYVYFRDRIFHRISEPQNSGVHVTPDGHTTILLELTCNVGDGRWTGNEETIEQIKSDLEAEKLLTRDQIVEIHRLTAEHGYPVYELDFEPYLEILNEKVESLVNLRSTGRQGGFTYPDMHKAMRMGVNAAEEILDLVQGQGTGRMEEDLVPG